MPAGTKRASTASWRTVEPAPIMLLRGPEDFIAMRVTDRVRATVREQEPDLETHRLSAADYEPGQLTMLASPSLFSQAKLIQVDDLQKMNDAFLAEALQYVKDPADDVTLLMRHTGGNRGKKLLDVLKKSGTVVECESIKSDRDKLEFVTQEFKAHRKKVASEAIRAVVDAVGSDMGELASAVDQLISDVEGPVTEQVVDRYYGGRVQATAFKVADATLDGQIAQAVGLLRHSLLTGVSPVAITAALAMKARQIARIIDARIGQGQIAQTLGVAPWQAKRIAATTRRWTAPGIAQAIELIAQADAEAKGLARDPDYSVERMIIRVAQGTRR
ncbi:DNA polymerase III subunit delta [Auritidibacter ignavus]|uniref:DNA polymerase III subunit delta n=1 Tax=Auritidibacter ignavus TaxID=678932 RepID=UPI002FE691A0